MNGDNRVDNKENRNYGHSVGSGLSPYSRDPTTGLLTDQGLLDS